MDVFGFNISRNGKIDTNSSESDLVAKEPVKSFITPESDDGAISVAGGYFGGQYVDFEGASKNDVDLIKKYRDMALHAEVEMAVDDIVNESIVFDGFKKPVEIYLDDLDAPESIKTKIRDEFEFIMKTVDFYSKGYELFRRWYVDGKLYFHIILDPTNPKKGIHELRAIDPIKIKKIRKINKSIDPKTGVSVIDSIEEFYVYLDNDDINSSTATTSDKLLTEQGIKVSPDSIAYAHSGLFDSSKKRVLGYLQKAIKPLNQLRMIEDSVVIYRISRAPERRIFYVDVGNLPKNKAEQYLRDVMNRYKNKMVYDASTGSMRDEHRHQSMLEDYWMPRREGGRGTEITTLDGGQNLGEMEDVMYFQKKLYKSLNVPLSRLEAENGFNMGRSSEITRDEVKFFKFIERLRKKFSGIFSAFLKVQLITKGIITEEDWVKYEDYIFYNFTKDSYFTELKENEILKERVDLLQIMDDYIGKYYSIEYVRKNILKQSEEDIKLIDTQIKSETASGDIDTDDDEGDDDGL